MSYAATLEEARAILTPSVRRELLALPHVEQVDVAVAQIGGRYTRELAIVVQVDEKLDRSELDSSELVPPEIDGVRTDVQETIDPRYVRPAALLAADRRRVRPLTCGISISPLSDRAGTLGFFARRNSDSKPVLVSNYHVLYWGRAFSLPGDAHVVLQPPVGTDNRIATVVNGKIGGTVDAAFAVLDEEGSSCCCKSVIPHSNIAEATSLTGVATAQPDMRVFKVGRSTGRSAGRVVHTGLRTGSDINYSDFDLPAGSAFGFTKLIAVVRVDESTGDDDPATPFTESGDSGAPLFNENGEIVGLHMSSFLRNGNHISFACHITEVERELEITVPGTRANLVSAPGSASTQLAGLTDPVDPASGTITIGSVEFEASSVQDQMRRLEDRAASTGAGRAWLALVEAHRFEILRLVNRCRPVTVAWHRAQGPAWLAALVRGAKHAEFELPDHIAGSTRESLVEAMRRVLHAHGSAELRTDLARVAPALGPILQAAESARAIAARLAQTEVPAASVTESAGEAR